MVTSKVTDLVISQSNAEETATKYRRLRSMALTRKYLSAMGIEPEKIDEIIEAHVETVNAVKGERDEYKAKAEQLDSVQAKLDEANKSLEEQGKDSYQLKYEAIKEEFEAYKNEQTAKATQLAKVDAYKTLLKDAGVSEKRIDAILKVTNLDDLKLTDDGLENADNLKQNILTEWADFITTTKTEGADTQTPPATGNEHIVKPIPTIF